MLNSKDFIKKTTYNNDTKNQLWCSLIADSHDIWCGCQWPFAHLLSTLFPPEHQDRELTINTILERDYKEKCHFSGEGETSTGMATGDAAATTGEQKEENQEEDYIKDEDLLQELIAAGEDAGGR